MKMGDRVQILAADYDEFQAFIGKTGTVDRVWGKDDVHVRIDGQPDDVVYSFDPKHLRLLPMSEMYQAVLDAVETEWATGCASSGSTAGAVMRVVRQQLEVRLNAMTPQIDWCQECGGFRETDQGSREVWIRAVIESMT